jgi:hypothetical protein
MLFGSCVIKTASVKEKTNVFITVRRYRAKNEMRKKLKFLFLYSQLRNMGKEENMNFNQ